MEVEALGVRRLTDGGLRGAVYKHILNSRPPSPPSSPSLAPSQPVQDQLHSALWDSAISAPPRQVRLWSALRLSLPGTVCQCFFRCFMPIPTRSRSWALY